MDLPSIPVDDFQARSHELWDSHWMLLCAGDFESRRFNMMTVSWGSFGTMWHKPFAQVVVRPQRHTYRFIEEFDTFTLCAFADRLRPVLKVLGSRSGRDIDKLNDSGLTPVASTRVAAPGFEEAELIVECRKIYWQDFEPTHFLDPTIDKNYPDRDYHRAYFGEVLAVRGTSAYRCD